MKIQTAIDQADEMRPNMMGDQLKVQYLQELDQQIYEEILLKHQHTAEEEVKPQYDPLPEDEEETEADENESEEEETEESEDTPYQVPDLDLLVPDPYSKLYKFYLMAHIDLKNHEYDKYNNDNALFETAYEEMHDWWRRTRMPYQALPFVAL